MHLARGDFVQVGGQQFRYVDSTIGAFDEANVPLCSTEDPWAAKAFGGPQDLVKVPAWKLDARRAIEAPDAANGATSVTTKWSSETRTTVTVACARSSSQLVTVRLGHPTDGQVFRVKSGELSGDDTRNSHQL